MTPSDVNFLITLVIIFLALFFEFFLIRFFEDRRTERRGSE